MTNLEWEHPLTEINEKLEKVCSLSFQTQQIFKKLAVARRLCRRLRKIVFKFSSKEKTCRICVCVCVFFFTNVSLFIRRPSYFFIQNFGHNYLLVVNLYFYFYNI